MPDLEGIATVSSGLLGLGDVAGGKVWLYSDPTAPWGCLADVRRYHPKPGRVLWGELAAVGKTVKARHLRACMVSTVPLSRVKIRGWSSYLDIGVPTEPDGAQKRPTRALDCRGRNPLPRTEGRTMKDKPALLILAASLLCTSPASASTVTAQQLNVRASSSADSPVVDTLRKGDEVTVCQRFGEWVRIDSADADRWVNARYIDDLVVADCTPQGVAKVYQTEEWTTRPSYSGGDSGSVFLGVAGILLLGGIYFLPTVVAVRRDIIGMGGVFVVNLLLGWTFLGWVISLAWAAGGRKNDRN